MTNFDAIILGSGQAGNPLAYKLAQDGKRVAVIERGPLGGTCINTGCTPTKAMIGSAQVAHYARNSARWGVHAGDVSVNMAEILERKEKIVAGSRSSWEKKFEGAENPKLYRGSAVFTGKRQLLVNGKEICAEHVFIDVGTRPGVPDIPGLTEVPYLSSDDMIQLREVPRHLIVIGGGYVGLEFAQMFRRFGSNVSVVQRGAQVLPREDADIVAELTRALESEGIRFYLNAKTRHIRQAGNEVEIELAGEDVLRGSHLLVATGRVPNTADIGLEKAGVDTDKKGFIQVDDRLKTSAEGVWALGDVTGGPQFTHISYNDFQIVYANVYQGHSLSTRDRWFRMPSIPIRRLDELD